MSSNPLFVMTLPTNSVSQPIVEPKSNGDPPPNVPYDRDYTLELTLKIPGFYPHTHQYSSLVEAENAIKSEEQEEIARKMKSLEQSVRDMQGLEDQKSVSLNNLCLFPQVHLRIKTPKFDKYDGHGDLVAHLIYCNQLRGAGDKKNCSWLILGKV